ncbi:hypothetical protein [Fusobacterium necrophorum]|uniref:hypothetical protein n=1 Tax=Fusobacterium necrophorum TaxID=859 RepID=UPI002A7D5A51|nr:hypothetical protein [Fusobacterium necrophorum]
MTNKQKSALIFSIGSTINSEDFRKDTSNIKLILYTENGLIHGTYVSQENYAEPIIDKENRRINFLKIADTNIEYFNKNVQENKIVYDDYIFLKDVLIINGNGSSKLDSLMVFTETIKGISVGSLNVR